MKKKMDLWRPVPDLDVCNIWYVKCAGRGKSGYE